MGKKRYIREIHVVAYVLMLVFIVIGFVKAAEGQEAFMTYLKEDGLVENLTTLFLAASSGIAVWRAVKQWQAGRKVSTLTWALLAFLFFFAAGEEISWGQRIFSIETPEYFMEKNLQKETNLHNLVIGNVKVNKLIFSQLLTAAMVVYFLGLRLLAVKTRFFRKVVSVTGLPLPRWEHTAALVIGTILVSQYHMVKAGELRELVFAVVFFLVFLYPFLMKSGEKPSENELVA
jgi:hypothetical protein